MVRDSITIDTPHARPRVRYILISTPTIRKGVMVLVILAFLLVFPLLALGLLKVCIWLVANTTQVNAIAAIVVLSGVILVAFLFFMRLIPYHRKSRNPFRIGRLEWLLDRRDGKRRFPHRYVEYACCGFPIGSKALKNSFSQVQSGEVIVVENPGLGDQWMVPATPLVFEPIPWVDSESRLVELAARVSQANAKPEYRFTPRVNLKPTWYSQLSGVQRLALHFLLFMTAFALLSADSASGFITRIGTTVLLILVVGAVMSFRSLIVGRRYFLVPGGLVRTENGLLFRIPRLEFMTPGNSALIVYPRLGCYVVHKGQARFLFSDDTRNRALMVAWFSTAQSPTMKELRTLLVPEAAMAANSPTSV